MRLITVRRQCGQPLPLGLWSCRTCGEQLRVETGFECRGADLQRCRLIRIAPFKPRRQLTLPDR